MKTSGILALLLLSAAAARPATPTVSKAAEAERVASTARAHAQDPAALDDARRALAMTDEFDPTAFVRPGRKGEIVEDAYRAALAEYRRHRARLYEAVGVCLDARGLSRPAVRYLRRALALDPEGADIAALAEALIHDQRPLEALDVIVSHSAAPLSLAAKAAVTEAADLAGIPSVQAELDRARLTALTVQPRPELREGPIRFGDRLRLSTGAPLRLEGDGVNVIYVGSASCQSCSQDLDEMKRLMPADVRAFIAAAESDDDRALRQTLSLYHIAWPLILGARPGAYGEKAPVVWLVGRRGWSGATLRSPLSRVLPAVLDVFARRDIDEALPRPKWNGRPAERRKLVAPPPLLPEGLAPGEDDPAPAEFDAAVKAFRAGRAREAQQALEVLAARGDGWLLSPEARLDRAQCLARAGDVNGARRLLRGIGDSRFQDRVDTALETP